MFYLRREAILLHSALEEVHLLVVQVSGPLDLICVYH